MLKCSLAHPRTNPACQLLLSAAGRTPYIRALSRLSTWAPRDVILDRPSYMVTRSVVSSSTACTLPSPACPNRAYSPCPVLPQTRISQNPFLLPNAVQSYNRKPLLFRGANKIASDASTIHTECDRVSDACSCASLLGCGWSTGLLRCIRKSFALPASFCQSVACLCNPSCSPHSLCRHELCGVPLSLWYAPISDFTYYILLRPNVVYSHNRVE
jgi:hypothetical protein